MNLLHLTAALLLSLAPQDDAKPDNGKIIAKQMPSYPLATCVVSGEGLHEMGEPIDMVHDGRLIRLCCKGCVKQLKKNPKKAFAALDAAVVKAQKASYALPTCPVSGEKLSEIEAPVDHVHGTRLVRLCCKMCLKKFNDEPAKYMPKVDEALIASQIKSYPIETCLVSSEGLEEMGKPVDLLYGTRLVRLCCKGCVKKFHQDPKAMLAKLDAAAEKVKVKKQG